MAVSSVCLFLTVPWVGLWSVIVAFPGHIYPRAFMLQFRIFVLIFHIQYFKKNPEVSIISCIISGFGFRRYLSWYPE